MKKYLILLLAMILMQPTSFAAGMKNTMGKVMDSWVGENIDTVINGLQCVADITVNILPGNAREQVLSGTVFQV